MSPIICGTIVNKGLGQPQFDRKLKMIQAPLFTMLQLVKSKEFVVNAEQRNAILDAVSHFLV